MDVRRRTEEIEHLAFAPWATFSDASRGRAVPEPQDPLRPGSRGIAAGGYTAKPSGVSSRKRRCSFRRKATCTAPG